MSIVLRGTSLKDEQKLINRIKSNLEYCHNFENQGIISKIVKNLCNILGKMGVQEINHGSSLNFIEDNFANPNCAQTHVNSIILDRAMEACYHEDKYSCSIIGKFYEIKDHYCE